MGIVHTQQRPIFDSRKRNEALSKDKRQVSQGYEQMSPSTGIRRSTYYVLAEDISSAVYSALQRVVDYRTYRSTIAELSRLSAHDLADLGLHRGEIRRVAHECVYGHRA